MDKYQDFKVTVQQDQWDSFQKEFSKVIDSNQWKLRDDLKKRGEDSSLMSNRDILCIESPKIPYEGGSLKAVLWMWMYDNGFEVFNIIPLIGNQLSCREYNHILEQFRQSIIDPMSGNFNLHVEVSKPYLDIVDTIGPVGLKKLEQFSRTSNRSTGHSHPMDFNKWCNFVFYLYDNRIDLSSDDLMHWLMEDGWTEEKAHELALDYEYSIDMLSHYEQDRR